VFGRAVQLEDAEPSIESDLLLTHADAAGDLTGRIRGQREALGGWDYGKRGVQRIAGALWMPGSRLDSARSWILASNSLWRVSKPEMAP
jgi:hypothetical protein